MTETNTWPGKPGVPLNPEKGDWHWVRTPDGELVPYNWVPAFEVDLGIWPAKWVYDLNEHWPPEDGTYHGPCLTPDQATALQAHVTELERLTKSLAAERNQLIGVLQLAVEQSGETGENEPAWLGPACRIMNAGFTKIAALEGKRDE